MCCGCECADGSRGAGRYGLEALFDAFLVGCAWLSQGAGVEFCEDGIWWEDRWGAGIAVYQDCFMFPGCFVFLFGESPSEPGAAVAQVDVCASGAFHVYGQYGHGVGLGARARLGGCMLSLYEKASRV